MSEPTVLETQEAVAAATIKKERPIGPVTNEEQALFDAEKKITSERAADAASQSIIESFVPNPPPTEARVRQVNNENLGVNRRGGEKENAGEKVYGRGERSKEYRQRADKFAGLAQEVISNGYDKLADSDDFTAVQKRKFMVDEMLEAVKSAPSLRGRLESFGPEGDAVADAARKAIAEDFLRNPQLLKHLADRFGEIYNGDSAILEDVVSEAEDEYRKINGDFLRKEAETTTVTGRISVLEARLKDFAIGGKDYDKFNEFDLKKKREFEGSQQKLSRLRQTITEFEKGFASGSRYDAATRESMLRDYRLQAETLEDNMEGLESSFDEWSKLQTEKAEAEKELKDLKDKEPGLQSELANLDINKSQAERKRNEARAARAAGEEDFTNKVEGMVREAGRRFIKEEVQKNEAARAKVVAKETSEAKDNDEVHIRNAMFNKLTYERRVGRRREHPVSKKEAQVAYDQIVNERSPDSLTKSFMRQSLIDLRHKGFGPGTTQYQEEERRLEERFRDKEFMKRMGGIVTEQVLRSYLESGNKIRPSDVSILSSTDWGEAMIDAAFTKNEEARKLMDKIDSKYGSTSGEKLRNLMKNPKTYGVGAGLLALIFGAPFLIAGAGVAASAYSAAAGAVS